ncbi:MAG: hypothetical protein QXM31_02370 [Candidatus Woesearchaeota archaeon]
MVQATNYFTKENFSLDSFREKAKEYLNNKSQTPVCVAPANLVVKQAGSSVRFTFSERLLEDILKHPEEYKKDFTAALTYGYIGGSNGGRNGIVRLRREDRKMQNAIDDYLRTHLEFLADVYDIGKTTGNELPRALEGVKIVVHRTNGIRTIGIRDPKTNNIHFFDRASYRL